MLISQVTQGGHVAEDVFSISTREDFDRFWQVGVELTGMRQSAAAYPTPGALPTPSLPPLPVRGDVADDPPVTAQVWWAYASTNSQDPVDLLIDPQLPVEVVLTLTT